MSSRGMQGHTAVFMEEPGRSSAQPYAHEFTSHVTISGDKVYVDYEGAWFYAVRKNGKSAGGGGGHWVPRSSDPQACTSGPGA